MKEILIVSGKGGTGKTSITAALASIAKNSVMADCDVDAADMHLILNPDIKEENEFISGHLAQINQSNCLSCGVCQQNCKFDAIKIRDGNYSVDAVACEGCGVCVWSCPASAIDFNDNLCGHWYISDTRLGPLVHSNLKAAAENSGKLVSKVRDEARKIAKSKESEFILIDGPPGIGCPVIASMTGVSAAIIVTEPTLSGLHDMERVLDLAEHFQIKAYACINKYDINLSVAKKITDILKSRNVSLIGQIPYSSEITQAQIEGKTIIEYSDGAASKAIKEMWQAFIEISN
ncbi:MAG: P-loop NTPase [Clostridia bacterium]|nr:P-loop NTPase [Clostridia bacterium]